MPKAGDYIVVHLVERREVGTTFEKRRAVWPLHITLASWFVATDVSKILQALQTAADAQKPFKLQVGSKELFGHDHDIPMNVIANQEPVKALHETLTAAIKQAGVAFESDHWSGEKYRAHITQHHDNANQEGDTVTIGNFHLIKLLPENRCEILHEFVLGSGR